MCCIFLCFLFLFAIVSKYIRFHRSQHTDPHRSSTPVLTEEPCATILKPFWPSKTLSLSFVRLLSTHTSLPSSIHSSITFAFYFDVRFYCLHKTNWKIIEFISTRSSVYGAVFWARKISIMLIVCVQSYTCQIIKCTPRNMFVCRLLQIIV